MAGLPRWEAAVVASPLGTKSDEDGDVLASRSLRRQAERKSRVVRAGCVYDYTADLIYNYFRDYDTSTGRYIQSDPIEMVPSWLLARSADVNYVPGTLQVGRMVFDSARLIRQLLTSRQSYAYATDNPLSYIDSFGLAPTAVCERYDGWGKEACELCVKTFCQLYPAAIACCAIERDECYGRTGGDPAEMEKCNIGYADCAVKHRKGGAKPPSPPKDI